MLHWFLLLALLLGAAIPRPLHQSDSYAVPEEFSAPLEIPQQHFGLVDDYGIKPKQPRFKTQAAWERPRGLHRGAKRKHSELDLLEDYNPAHL